MNLVGASMLNALAVGVKLLTYVGLNKILAVYIGPAGYAVVGQFQNFIAIVTTFAGGAINGGVVKYTAEYADNADLQRRAWRTAGTISLVVAFVFAVVVALFSQAIAQGLLSNGGYQDVVLWFALAFPFFVLNALLLSILNGRKEIRRYVLINIVGSIVGLLVTGALSITLGLRGVLIALAVNQSLIFLFAVAYSMRGPWFRLRNLWGEVDRDMARKLAGFAMMSLTSAAVMPLVQMLIRDHIVDVYGLRWAGQWQAVTKISDLYLMLVTSTLGVYYLPRLSEIRQAAELKKEILVGYAYILPFTALVSLAIYLLRDEMIRMLFTPDFADMGQLLGFQLLGDVVKMASWLLGYTLIGQAMVLPFIVTEILFGAISLMLVHALTPIFQVQGVVIAYCLSYALHWLAMMYLVQSRIRTMEQVGRHA